MPRTLHRFDTTRIAPYYCTGLAAHLEPGELMHLRAYLDLCLAKGQFPAYRSQAVDIVLLSKLPVHLHLS